MVDYADLARVQTILGTTTEPDAATFAALNAVASRELERACGVESFGTAAADQAVTLYPTAGSDVLVLDRPVRSVTSLTVNDTVITAYRLIWRTGQGSYLGITTTDGTLWGGTVAITGQWGDMPGGEALDEVIEATSILVAGYYRKDRASDGEVSGPEGFTFRPSNPWNDERVKRTVQRYKAAMVLVV